MTGPRSRVAADGLNGFSVAQRELYTRIADSPETDWTLLLAELHDLDLREMQRMGYATRDAALKPAVELAVRRRPHRGCWPSNLDRETHG